MMSQSGDWPPDQWNQGQWDQMSNDGSTTVPSETSWIQGQDGLWYEAAGRMNDGRMGYGGLKGQSRNQLSGKGKSTGTMWPVCSTCTGRHNTNIPCPNVKAIAMKYNANTSPTTLCNYKD